MTNKPIALASVEPMESLAYWTQAGWAYSGHRFHEAQPGGQSFTTRESFACGAVRWNNHSLSDRWAVIRGSEVYPLI